MWGTVGAQIVAKLQQSNSVAELRLVQSSIDEPCAAGAQLEREFRSIEAQRIGPWTSGAVLALTAGCIDSEDQARPATHGQIEIRSTMDH